MNGLILEEELKKLTKNYYTEINPQQMLYHYTDINGLKGIIETGQFFASKADFLNDYSEIKYSYNLVIEVIDNLISKDIAECEKNFYKNLKCYINSRISSEWDENYLKDRVGKYRSKEYIVSFSKNSDSLTLWSEYSDFYGYNLGFRLSSLLEYMGNLNEKGIYLICSDVIYNKTEQIKIIENEITEFKIMISNLGWFNDILSREDKDKILIYFVSRLRGYGTIFKDAMFKQEEEYRFLFYTTNENPYYRISNYCLIPYIKVPFDTSIQKIPVQLVTIGAKNKLVDVAREGVAYFLYDNNYNLNNIEIITSKVALRY